VRSYICKTQYLGRKTTAFDHIAWPNRHHVPPQPAMNIRPLADVFAAYYCHALGVKQLHLATKEEHPVTAQENQNILIGPDEGLYLPVLDIVHKL
jgi:hypothetical protein